MTLRNASFRGMPFVSFVIAISGMALATGLISFPSAFSFVKTAHAQASAPDKNNRTAASSPRSVSPKLRQVLNDLPLSFEANQGQTDPRVRFLSRGDGYSLMLTRREAVLQLPIPESREIDSSSISASLSGADLISALQARASSGNEQQRYATVRMKMLASNPTPHIEGLEQQPGHSSYFIGNDSNRWRTGTPNFARVRYREIWPGIDFVCYGNQRQFEYDLIVAPGADPRRIGFAFSGISNLRIDDNGDLVLRSAGGELRQHKPVIYQTVNGVRQSVNGRYVLKSRYQVGFAIDSYDRSRELVIDPILSYATYLGGLSEEVARNLTVDSAGNVYITGTTSSLNFPATNSSSMLFSNKPDGFVTKLNATGSARVYSVYFGGREADAGLDIATDAAGNAYVAGGTFSPNFPATRGAFQSVAPDQDGSNGFVFKLNAAGTTLLYSTYLGGSGEDGASSLAVNADGQAFVSGVTSSDNFPVTQGALQTVSSHNFLSKLNAVGSALVYSTFFGTSKTALSTLPETAGDIITDLAIDSAGNVYVTGATSLTNFQTTPGAFQTVRADPDDSSTDDIFTEAFVSKLNVAGTALVYSTYLGGRGIDGTLGIAVDAAGSAHVVGTTNARNFPITGGAFQTAKKDAGPLLSDAFVTKLNPAGSALLYSTYLGGSVIEVGTSIALDTAGNAYVTGLTNSSDFPVTVTAFQAQPGAGGISRSTNSGTNWNLTSNGLGNFSIHALAIHPQTPATIYAGTFGGVFKTTNSGATWTASNTGLNNTQVLALAIDPQNFSTLYAGTVGGVYKSVNAGATWTAMNNGLIRAFDITGIDSAIITALAINPQTPATIYAATAGSGLFRSTNGGNTWTQIGTNLQGQLPDDFIFSLAIDPTSPATIYAGVSFGVFKSFDGGITWFVADINLPSNPILSLLIDPTDQVIIAGTDGPQAPQAANTLYAGLAEGGVFKTINGGLSWFPVNSGLPNAFSLSNVNGPVILALALNPQSPATVFTSTFDGGVFRSTNGGQSWTAINTGLNSRQVFALAVEPGNPTNVLAGADSLLDGFVAKLNPTGSQLSYASYFGSNGLDVVMGVAVDPAGNAYLAGGTTSRSFPVTAGVFQSAFNGGISDVVIAKIAPDVVTADLQLTVQASPNPVVPGALLTYNLTLTNNGPEKAEAARITLPLPAGTTFVSCNAPGGVCGADGNVRIISYAELADKAVVNSSIVVAVNSSLADGTILSTTSTVSATTTDPNLNNNSAATSVTVRVPPVATLRIIPGGALQLGPVRLTTTPGSASNTFTIENTNTFSAQIVFSSLRRLGSDVNGQQIIDADDRALFSLQTGAGTPINIGTSTIVLPPGQPQQFRVVFNPVIPALSGRSTQLLASQVLPDVITAQLSVRQPGAPAQTPAQTIDLIGNLNTEARLIHPANTRLAPQIAFTRDGDEFTVECYVHDPNLDLSLVRYQFLDANQQSVSDNYDISLTEIIRQSGLIKGQSFSITQKFRGASRTPNAARVRVTIYDTQSDTALSGVLGSVEPRAATVSAASYRDTGLASEAIAAAFGTNLATATKAASVTPLPQELGGTRAFVLDRSGIERAAPLFFVSPGQINFQIPSDTVPGTAVFRVVNEQGSVSTGSIEITSTSPGVFTANASGSGVAAGYVLRVKADGSQHNEPIARFDAAQNKFIPVAIEPGADTDQLFLVLFGTGIRHHGGVKARAGSQEIEVLYAGAQGDFVGLDQINLRLPRNLAGRGELEVLLETDSRPANPVRISFGPVTGNAAANTSAVSISESVSGSQLILPPIELRPPVVIAETTPAQKNGDGLVRKFLRKLAQKYLKGL